MKTNQLATAAVVLLLAAAAEAQVPNKLPVQGVLTFASGVPIVAPTPVTFAIYDVASGGAALYTETLTITPVEGVFSVVLGAAGAGIDMTVFTGEARWLGIKVSADAEMTPRLELASVPYAALANEVVSVPSGAVMFFDLGACPLGWSPLTAAQGRVVVGAAPGGAGTTVGTPLTSGAARTISEVAAHLHALASQTVTVVAENAHSHSVGVNPDSYTITSSGSHTHSATTAGATANPSIDISNGGYSADYVQGAAYNSSSHTFNATSPMGDSSHTHTVTVASETHTHVVDLPLKTVTSAAGSSHTHTASFAAFSSGSTGPASVDVTMPYLQLVVCRKN